MANAAPTAFGGRNTSHNGGPFGVIERILMRTMTIPLLIAVFLLGSCGLIIKDSNQMSDLVAAQSVELQKTKDELRVLSNENETQKVLIAELNDEIGQLKTYLSSYENTTTGLGVITGRLSYPSDWIPPEMVVTAHNLVTQRNYTTTDKFQDEEIGKGIRYKIEVPPGFYFVFSTYESFYYCDKDHMMVNTYEENIVDHVDLSFDMISQY